MTIEEKRAAALNAAIAYANMQINTLIAAETKQTAPFKSGLSNHEIGSIGYIDDLSEQFFGYIETGNW